MNPWAETKDTVLHEIAHALAGVGHGKKFVNPLEQNQNAVFLLK